MAKKLCIAAACAIALAGCDMTDPIYETEHPAEGMIILSTDWGATNLKTAPEEGYMVTSGGFSARLRGSSNRLNCLFVPGEHAIYIHNTPQEITVTGTTAQVSDPSSANKRGTDLQDIGIQIRMIHPLPEWLYTGVLSVTVNRDTDLAVTVSMVQQVREVTLTIKPSGGAVDRIAEISGSLSGVAGMLDFATGAYSQPGNVSIHFSPDADGDYKATIRLLGVTDSPQELSISIYYLDNTPSWQMNGYDVTSLFAGFNDDKATPLTLAAQLAETPTPTGLVTTITPWRQETRGEAIAD